MGGCRCVYRTCQSSTSITPGLHYFHFPVRDQERCDQWITNARKPMLRAISKEKLRNKVICSLHFEEKCFTNEKHDRLIHNAVPTLGFEDAPEDYESFANQSDLETMKDENNIMLVPVNENNTEFILPDVEFSGMSYTIYDDSVIPTSNVPLFANQSEKKSKISIVVKKHLEAENKPKRPKFTVTSVNKVISPNSQKSSRNEMKEESLSPKETKANNFEFNNGNIMSYSVSTCGDDVMVELSNQQKPEENEAICTFSIENQAKPDAPLLDNDISLRLKSGNEYTMSVVSTPNVGNVVTIPYEHVENTCDETSQSETIQDNTQEIPKKDDCVEKTNDFNAMPEKEYIRMIENNSKQITQLKKVVNRQHRLHQYLLQRKQLPKFRKRQWNKFKILENLKGYVKPSLMAIIKLEILSRDEVMLSDHEEKFITDLYTEHPECYNLLLKKYKWNLPNSENFNEENGN